MLMEGSQKSFWLLYSDLDGKYFNLDWSRY